MLEGTTVLDLASVGPAARASRWLGDYGASVIKVGPVPAQGGVQIAPPFHAYSAGRGTRRVLLDLKMPAGRDVLLRLTATADVLIESFRPGVMDRLGVGYDAARAVNPRIVYCSTTGYGQSGPASQWAGHDLNYLGIGGYLAASGRGADGRPPIPGATLADSAGGGMHAVIAILAALVRSRGTGHGAYLDVSVTDGLLSLMALQVDEYLATGDVPRPGQGLLNGRYACYGVYATADGEWVTVAAIEPRFWANLCHALGLERWIEHQTDDGAQDRIRADMEAVFRTRDRDAWVATLAPADTCVGPVLGVDEVVGFEHFTARGDFIDAKHPVAGDFRQVAPTLAGMPSLAPGTVVPEPGATDTDLVLGAVGYTDADIQELRTGGAVA